MHKDFDMQPRHTLVMCAHICMCYVSMCVCVNVVAVWVIVPLTVTQTCASVWGP